MSKKNNLHSDYSGKEKMPRKAIIFGGTAQAMFVEEILAFKKIKVLAVFDDTKNLQSPIKGVKIYQGLKSLKLWKKDKDISKIGFVVAIGNPYSKERVSIHNKIKKLGFIPLTCIHPTATVSNKSLIEEGGQILAGAIISPNVKIGKSCIVNQQAVVGASTIIGEGSEIAPGALVNGEVKIGRHSWICTGSSILPRLNIGNNVIVGAGAVVIRSVKNDSKVLGIPAKEV